ncbi:phage holin family protein [Nocardia sp. NPDC051030]|uniref:phage holin family protein n=1 Tax=Nocardia sp. NPDC051030 TaxID=3155162 RepID=UPI003446BF5C
MASYHNSYGTAVEVPPGTFERAIRYLLAEFSAWLGPRLHRAGKFLFAELVRGLIAAAMLGFAAIAAIYGTIYFFSFLVELLSQWMPHWAALLTTSSIMLVPAAIAALIGVWQIFKMRSVRTTAAVAAQAGGAIRAFANRNRADGKDF